MKHQYYHICSMVVLYLDKNSQAVKKRCGPVQNGQHKKSCEIQTGGQEMAVMVG